MTMDRHEILVDYKAAKNKKNQISVLAQLNACTTTRIARIIAEAGEPLPEPYRKALGQTGPALTRGGDKRSGKGEEKDRKPEKDQKPADPNPVPETKPEAPKDRPGSALVTRDDLEEMLGAALTPEPTVSREEYRLLYEQVAGLTETAGRLATALGQLEQEKRTVRASGFTPDHIKTAAFDLISEEVAGKGGDEDRLGRVVIALAAYRSLIARLTGGEEELP